MLGVISPAKNVGTVAKVNKTRRQKSRELRAYVAEMPRAEAIDHLIYLFEELTGIGDPIVGHFPDDPLSPMERALFCVLYRWEGKHVTNAQIMAAVYPCTVDAPEARSVHVIMHRLRRKISDYATISRDAGLGYVLTRNKGVLFPWGAQ